MAVSEAGQSYKIYVNDCLLTIAADEARASHLQEYGDALLLHYRGKVKLLHNVLDNLEKSKIPRQIILTTKDLKKLFEDTIGLFRWTEAGGGVVRNPKGEILAIYRRNRWDLPKGKLDPGETFAEAAVREVMEETGIRDVTLGPLITTSMHAFRTRRNQRALKVTKWYAMTSPKQKLKWQVEEDIEEATWIKPSKFMNGSYDMYESIRDVLKQYLVISNVQ